MEGAPSRDREIRTTKYPGARNSKFQVRRGSEANLLAMNPWSIGERKVKSPLGSRLSVDEMMSGKATEEKFCSHGAEVLQDSGQQSRIRARDPNHSHGLGVVTPHQGTATTRTPPQALPASANLPRSQFESHIGVQEMESAHGG